MIKDTKLLRDVVLQSPARQVDRSDRNFDGTGIVWTICSSYDKKFQYH